MLLEEITISDDVSMRGKIAIKTIMKWLDEKKPVFSPKLFGIYTTMINCFIVSLEYKYGSWLFEGNPETDKSVRYFVYVSNESIDGIRLSIKEKDGVKTLFVSNATTS